MATKEKIVIEADDKTARAFKSVQSAAKKTADDLSSMSMKMAGLAAAGAVAAGGLFLLTKRAIENADSIAKVSDKIGLNVESLQELRFAAEQAGVGQDTLDMAMQRFSRRVGEAVQGQGELKATLEQYGIALRDAEGNARSLELVLGDYANAIQNASSEQEQLRLAFKGFDSEGAALVNLLRRGSDGMQTLRNEARNLGLVLDEDAVRGAEAANDALNRMEKIVSVNLQRVLIEFGPVIENLAIQFANAAPAILEFANNIIKLVFGVEALSLQGLRQEIDDLGEELIKYNATRKAVGDMSAEEFEQHKIRVGNYIGEINTLSGLIKAKEKEQEAREALLKFSGANDNNAGDAAAEKAAENERKLAEALLAQIAETNLQVLGANEALLEQKHQQEMDAIYALYEAKTISDQEFFDASYAAKETFEQRKLDLLDQRLEEEIRRESDAANEKAAIARKLADAEYRARRGLHDGLTAIAALQNVQSRKAFEIGKAAAASLALVKTYEGAQGVFASAAQVPYVGWILAPIAAAAAVVTGLANVRSILSTSYGSSSSGGGGAGGGVGMPSIPSPDVPALAPPANDQGQARDINVIVASDTGMVSMEWVRESLLPSINEALGDGVELNVSTG